MDQVRVEDAWTFPVPKPDPVMGRVAPKIDDNAGNDESHDEEDLESGEEDFGLVMR